MQSVQVCKYFQRVDQRPWRSVKLWMILESHETGSEKVGSISCVGSPD